MRVGAGQDEQVVHQLGHAAALPLNVVGEALRMGGVEPQGGGGGGDDGQRGFQFMGGRRDEFHLLAGMLFIGAQPGEEEPVEYQKGEKADCGQPQKDDALAQKKTVLAAHVLEHGQSVPAALVRNDRDGGEIALLLRAVQRKGHVGCLQGGEGGQAQVQAVVLQRGGLRGGDELGPVRQGGPEPGKERGTPRS